MIDWSLIVVAVALIVGILIWRWAEMHRRAVAILDGICPACGVIGMLRDRQKLLWPKRLVPGIQCTGCESIMRLPKPVRDERIRRNRETAKRRVEIRRIA